MNELGIHGFNVGKNEELLNGGMVAHVAFFVWVGDTPLLSSAAKERDVEQVSFGGVGEASLSF